MIVYLKNMPMLFSKSAATAIVFLLVSTVLVAQVDRSSSESIFDQMSHTDVLDITIAADLSVVTDKSTRTKQKGTLRFTDGQGKEQVWPVKLVPRGKFRRTRCTKMPPLKIHFDKDDLRAAGLATFDDYKLVNQCIEEKTVAKELLLKEYLAYKLYNNITEESFRVLFLNITYVDSKTGKKSRQPGFLIEDTAQLRHRIGANKIAQSVGFSARDFDIQKLQTTALFQYWIGNADWSVSLGKNIKVLEKGGHLIAIPYDFDFSGMVNAPYARPNVDYGLTSLQQRIYLGFATEASQLEGTIDRFVALRPVFRKTVKKFKLLNWNARDLVWSFLDAYFEEPTNVFFGAQATPPNNPPADTVRAIKKTLTSKK